MFTIDIKKEVQDLVDQVSQQTGATLDENVIMLMEWSMKMGIIKNQRLSNCSHIYDYSLFKLKSK